MPARGPLTCDQLEKRHNNGRTERGRNRSLSSAIRKGCGWASSKPPPNPCEPKPRAFVTRAKDREVAFMVSGGDCPPGVRADPTEADKQRIKDAAARCTGTRPSSSFKQCVVDALKAMAEKRKAPKVEPVAPPEPIAPMAPPAFAIQQLPPHLVNIVNRPAATPPPRTYPAPPPSVFITMPGADSKMLPPIPPRMPSTLGRPAEPFSESMVQQYADATMPWVESDYPLRAMPEDILLGPFLSEYRDPAEARAHRLDYWNYLRDSYPGIEPCKRMRLRKRPTMGKATADYSVQREVSRQLAERYGKRG